MSKLDTYRQAQQALPANYEAWQVFGAGLENVGRDGKSVTVPMRAPAANEVLLRIDALGLCLSDMKIINQGGNHPRLRGRDLQNDPTVLGHECAATIVAVGENWKDQFQPGQRFIVQADIYYKGVGYAFGYMIPGGLAEYAFLDERGLAGDEGCYLLPVKESTGFSEAALSEPWACVVMSYALDERVTPTGAAQLVVADDPADWAEKLPRAQRVPKSLDGLADDARFDDIILVAPTPALVETLGDRLNPNGIMFLLGDPAEDGDAQIDVGAIHYQNKRYLGGGSTLEEVAEANRRIDLLPGGTSLFIGAGGPMGQMHVQRAIEMRNGSGCVVVTDLDRGRLTHIEKRFGDLAKERNVKLITLAPGDFEDQQAMNLRMAALGGANGYDDVVVLAPVPALVKQAVELSAKNAFVNLFAGLATGTRASVSLRQICRGVKMIGCSGSRIKDLRDVLNMVEAGTLDSNRSVAAIGGLDAAHKGLAAVKNAVYPGKTVIYPQIPSFPLTAIDELVAKEPEIAAALGTGGVWTNEAEKLFLEKYLP
ncbi:MAG TPA: alcohol dehydrogenase catalytic domain-containing protein [Candidatus Hydrogenedentes bacterium]|nr:alcohol dehydrogenase catalytic domain-containing protein [Candidatus Hydrogenedentota bacterium]HOR51316.1 alcohol dehydrogenase catalytic domain-containing protein [Candidatus Hydrogenedentota bacterium]HPK24257.1 alcohol dehydrogenase catalytic domain-containing protein [Candidatus Hydrogenedentota bacterium]